MMLVFNACGQNKKSDMKTLVAYFSATGTTEAVAKDLAEVTGATLYEIKPEVKYTAADLDWTVKTSRSSVEMQDKNSRPAIVKDLEDADSYDVIFIATSGGSSIDKANKEFAAAYPKINWKAGKTLNNVTKAEIKTWAEGLK